MATVARKQDLPPPGGYQKIPYARVPAKTFFSGWSMLAGFAGITAASLYVYFITYKGIKQNEIESRSARLALFPLLLAERDREYLKQLRKNREEERELMKNVDGWKVGTLFGEPIYKTQKEDKLVEPTFHEYYVHADHKSFAQRAHIKLWS
ncbi:NADH dehydrogenase [ubiquinone] 1 alpha subcomplex subunit 13 [Chrysoperla carnea]|uniref:NADH dehydrogenase [ubiquinone] 1 alpha subcomplex subunit 13 n=1 Tax=Chrysoperla carnea TaxID=189513 RepID=UPI001D082793|nr:NADH dehydrogenase [ubiquinone] 1 alpha subcomplex subunit 13 [Chrysoperla carnea]